ncbi:MAG: hypothetical protein NT159_20285 [Proteobacteria bacterium]|nr:hypothetical protein [Pseudomonadota bacterium]
MKSRRVPMIVLGAVMLCGCNNKPKTEPPPPPLPQMIQDRKQVLDSAKAMGDTLDKQAEEQRKRIEEATK